MVKGKGKPKQAVKPPKANSPGVMAMKSVFMGNMMKRGKRGG